MSNLCCRFGQHNGSPEKPPGLFFKLTADQFHVASVLRLDFNRGRVCIQAIGQRFSDYPWNLGVRFNRGSLVQA